MSLYKCSVFLCLTLALTIAWSALIVNATAVQSASTLPAQLTDAEFWRMVTDFSEPGGAFPYENFVSNEGKLQTVIPALKRMTKSGGAYIGVGPEQNFTLASALQSKMAFVIDIRRQNMLELLMYKALFEMSPNRADFVSRLFSRRRPSGLDDKASADALFAAYEPVKADADFYVQNLQDIKNSIAAHKFQLSSDDLLKIDYVYQVFYRAGASINYAFASATPGGNSPSYRENMTATDTTGRNWSYLASEENFQYIREMQRKNMIVPLVGDFAGPSAIRNVGRYLKDHNTIVSAFYVSNVEGYLDAKTNQDFYASTATLPIDASSTFIRFIDGVHQSSMMPSWWRSGASPTGPMLVSPMVDLVNPIKAGLHPSYEEMVRTMPDPLTLAGLPGRDADIGVGPLQFVPKGAPAPVGYTLIGTTRQTIQLLDGTSRTADLDVYSKK